MHALGGGWLRGGPAGPVALLQRGGFWGVGAGAGGGEICILVSTHKATYACPLAAWWFGDSIHAAALVHFSKAAALLVCRQQGTWCSPSQGTQARRQASKRHCHFRWEWQLGTMWWIVNGLANATVSVVLVLDHGTHARAHPNRSTLTTCEIVATTSYKLSVWMSSST